MATFSEAEKSIQQFWKENRIFERSVSERPESKRFSFYDGPPFATGLPHYGHIVASTIKDVVPRYWTMQGYRVERRWGWDCHGLPVENLIEKELGLKSKKDIEAMGVAQFNDACRTSVLTYTNEWRETIERLGRFVDMDNDYRTMDTPFMESVWWVFKQLFDKGLIYEGKKSMHVCPRCGTPLSNFEVTLGYKDIPDTSAFVLFTLNEPHTIGLPGKAYMVAWTTTPWTLPGNALLAVNADETYAVARYNDGHIIFAKALAQQVAPELTIVKELKGSELVGNTYQPLFSYYQDNPNSFRVVAGDFVTMEDGTGIVHIAPGYGEDDYQLSLKEGTGLIQHVNMSGQMVDAVTDFAGKDVKPKGNHQSMDQAMVKWLEEHGQLYKALSIKHSYPHCWRCDTPLINYATSSWFVKVTQLKEGMIKNNGQVNWTPEHIKEGRFGKWLEGAKDWAISRERYWGAPVPIWKAEDGELLCIGSQAELEQLSGQKVDDLHKQFVDVIEIQKDGKTFKRIAAVLDCWFESGSMPYGQQHYPFEHKEQFEQNFPAQFIAEGLDQTRGWFYTLTVLSTALFNTPAFKNVVVNGLVLAEDGKKMSKRLKNYPEPGIVLDKYGADALRFYLMSSPVVKAEDLRFSERGVDLVMKRVLLTLWNIVSFYTLFEAGVPEQAVPKPMHVMDQWVLAYTHQVVTEITDSMNSYDLMKAATALEAYIQEVSTWYIRRSRGRFKDADSKAEAVQTLRYVLDVTAKLIAPFMPFMAERVYQTVHPQAATSGDSVHLQLWPTAEVAHQQSQLLSDMVLARDFVEQILAQRETLGIKIRQPLGMVTLPTSNLSQALVDIVLEEVNIKSARSGVTLELDTTITPELAEEGLYREFVRQVNALRKQLKLTLQDTVELVYVTESPEVDRMIRNYAPDLQSAVLARTCVVGTTAEHELKVNGQVVSVTLQR